MTPWGTIRKESPVSESKINSAIQFLLFGGPLCSKSKDHKEIIKSIGFYANQIKGRINKIKSAEYNATNTTSSGQLVWQ